MNLARRHMAFDGVATDWRGVEGAALERHPEARAYVIGVAGVLDIHLGVISLGRWKLRPQPR